MKFPALLLGFALVCSLSIAGYIHSKRKHEINLNKQASFLDIKFRVTRDVLGEYQDQLIQANTMMDKTKKEVDTLTKDLSDMKNSAAKKKTDVDTCNKDKKRITSDTSSAQSEKTKIQKEFVKEKSRLEEEIAGLKKQTEQQSKLCNYIDKTSAEGRKLCGLSEEPQKPEAKAEEPNPKPEEPKAEEPKAEEPKPKPEEPKAEEPKAEEPKAEEPKAEEPKAEEPKPKPEEPKAEQPKVDVQ